MLREHHITVKVQRINMNKIMTVRKRIFTEVWCPLENCIYVIKDGNIDKEVSKNKLQYVWYS